MKIRDRNLLVRLRTGADLSQRELARAVGISHGFLAEMERGNRQPSLAVARRIAEHFEISLGALCEETPLEFGEPHP